MDKEQLWIDRVKRKQRSRESDKLISKFYDEIYVFACKQTFDKNLAARVEELMKTPTAVSLPTCLQPHLPLSDYQMHD